MLAPGPEASSFPLLPGPSLSLSLLFLSCSVSISFLGLSSVEVSCGRGAGWAPPLVCSASSRGLDCCGPADLTSRGPLALTLILDRTLPSSSCFSWVGLLCFPGNAFDSFGMFLPWVSQTPHCFPGFLWSGSPYHAGLVTLSGLSPPICILWLLGTWFCEKCCLWDFGFALWLPCLLLGFREV